MGSPLLNLNRPCSDSAQLQACAEVYLSTVCVTVRLSICSIASAPFYHFCAFTFVRRTALDSALEWTSKQFSVPHCETWRADMTFSSILRWPVLSVAASSPNPKLSARLFGLWSLFGAPVLHIFQLHFSVSPFHDLLDQ